MLMKTLSVAYADLTVLFSVSCSRRTRLHTCTHSVNRPSDFFFMKVFCNIHFFVNGRMNVNLSLSFYHFSDDQCFSYFCEGDC